MRDACPCGEAMATRGGDKQEPNAPPLSFPRVVPPLLSSSRAVLVLVSLSPWGEREG